MTDINNITSTEWLTWWNVTLIIIIGIPLVYKIFADFIEVLKKCYNKIKGIDNRETDKYQNLEIDKIKARQDNFENNLNMIKENVMISTWDRIMHFGMNYISRGHITYAEKDVFDAQCRSYAKCGGNGHLAMFVPMVDALPYTEDLTEEDIQAIDNDEIAKKKRVRLAQASLSAYYGK